LGYSVVGLDGHDRGLGQHDTMIAQVYNRIGRAQVDRQIRRSEPHHLPNRHICASPAKPPDEGLAGGSLSFAFPYINRTESIAIWRLAVVHERRTVAPARFNPPRASTRRAQRRPRLPDARSQG